MKLWRCLVVVVFLSTGCGTPAFTSSMRSNGFAANARIQSTCRSISRRQMGDVIAKHYANGWRLAYVSEYTSSGTASISVVACFERVAGKGAPKGFWSPGPSK